MRDDVEEPKSAHPATRENPGTPDRILMERHSLTHLSSPSWREMCLDYEVRDSSYRELSKIDAVVSQLQFDYVVLAVLSVLYHKSYTSIPPISSHQS